MYHLYNTLIKSKVHVHVSETSFSQIWLHIHVLKFLSKCYHHGYSYHDTMTINKHDTHLDSRLGVGGGVGN